MEASFLPFQSMSSFLSAQNLFFFFPVNISQDHLLEKIFERVPGPVGSLKFDWVLVRYDPRFQFLAVLSPVQHLYEYKTMVCSPECGHGPKISLNKGP